MRVCPYCGGKLKGGRDGVDKHLLLEIMCGDKKPTSDGNIMLRVQICELNDVIAHLKQRIVARRNMGYFLVAAE